MSNIKKENVYLSKIKSKDNNTKIRANGLISPQPLYKNPINNKMMNLDLRENTN